MATRSGKEAPGKRNSGAASRAGHDSKNQRPESRLRGQAGTGDRETDEGTSPTFAEVAARQRVEREDGAAGVRRPGPRRVLIFARTLKEASAIAKRKGYPRELWRFVTGIADTDVDPREWATITVVGFGKNRPFAKDAYDLFQARCRGFGIRAPSYDP